ncbi:hypothetical protein AVEN_6441-1 [Araneus ventricosus]|uniref:Uncharacterized protein n=1 Tax=Araneus ventricosus TaxID=182803 RepID=A0A4Y2HT85_ARAVE|nr:hypothetical protein AVEN_6441-1 [Araneus ventricosus]
MNNVHQKIQQGNKRLAVSWADDHVASSSSSHRSRLLQTTCRSLQPADLFYVFRCRRSVSRYIDQYKAYITLRAIVRCFRPYERKATHQKNLYHVAH